MDTSKVFQTLVLFFIAFVLNVAMLTMAAGFMNMPDTLYNIIGVFFIPALLFLDFLFFKMFRRIYAS